MEVTSSVVNKPQIKPTLEASIVDIKLKSFYPLKDNEDLIATLRVNYTVNNNPSNTPPLWFEVIKTSIPLEKKIDGTLSSISGIHIVPSLRRGIQLPYFISGVVTVIKTIFNLLSTKSVETNNILKTRLSRLFTSSDAIQFLYFSHTNLTPAAIQEFNQRSELKAMFTPTPEQSRAPQSGSLAIKLIGETALLYSNPLSTELVSGKQSKLDIIENFILNAGTSEIEDKVVDTKVNTECTQLKTFAQFLKSN